MRKTMFFPAKHEDVAELVRIGSPSEARRAVASLKRYAKGKPHRTRLLVKRSMVLAANRAGAMRKRRNLTPGERKEMASVERIYRRGYKTFRW